MENFDSLEKEFLTVWKGKFWLILTVWKRNFWQFGKGNFWQFGKGIFDSLERETWTVKSTKKSPKEKDRKFYFPQLVSQLFLKVKWLFYIYIFYLNIWLFSCPKWKTFFLFFSFNSPFLQRIFCQERKKKKKRNAKLGFHILNRISIKLSHFYWISMSNSMKTRYLF